MIVVYSNIFIACYFSAAGNQAFANILQNEKHFIVGLILVKGNIFISITGPY
jgi:hypothetical protein